MKMMLTVSLPFIAFGWLFFCLNICLKNCEQHIASISYNRFPNVKLNDDKLIKTVKSLSVRQCSMHCSKIKHCRSFNFATDSNDSRLTTCELSTKIKQIKPTSNFVEDDRYNFYQDASASGPCDNNPCEYNGVCSVTGNDFSCVCSRPMGGKDCSEVQCGGRLCFRKGDLIIYIYNSKYTSYQDSKINCEKNNMTLLMIKDQDTDDFVRGILLNIYADKPDLQDCYFIGLFRINDTEPFHWPDGTPLGQFQPWSHQTYDGESRSCVCLPSPARYQFHWDHDRCSAMGNNWTYYHICGKIWDSNSYVQATFELQIVP